ncbi:MAG: inorganic diphosphatase [Pyrinomonadaceae bacterium]
MSKNPATGISSLEAFDGKTKELNVVIETPKGSRNKYKFDEEKEIFKLGGILPLGASFPFDFGFIPQTIGGDGDPLDILILMDEPAFAGCLIPARLVGVIEAEQTEDGKTERNDRLIAVACKSLTHSDTKTLNDLNENLVEQIKHFFVSYNEAKGKKFEPIGGFGVEKAERLVLEGVKIYRAKKRRKTAAPAKK